MQCPLRNQSEMADVGQVLRTHVNWTGHRATRERQLCWVIRIANNPSVIRLIPHYGFAAAQAGPTPVRSVVLPPTFELAIST